MNSNFTSRRRLRRLGNIALLAGTLTVFSPWCPAGTWIPLQTTNTEGIGTILLLSDGTVMANGVGGGYGTTSWYKLSPGAAGGYTNGAWSALAPMNYVRRFFASDVLKD
jgi:hypothetical protein